MDNTEYNKSLCTRARESSDPVELEELAQNEYWLVRSYVASNVYASAETVDRLSKDINDNVRRHVASNNNTSAEALTRLSEDGYIARAAVAGNPNTDLATVVKLMSDIDHQIRDIAKENLKSRSMLDELLS